jgi:hypothetical protein
MNGEKRAVHVSILLCVAACFTGLIGAQGQQSATAAHVGPSAPRPGSTAGARAPVRDTGSGGASTWGAGKGSFAYSVQRGGVWSDGTTLGAAPGAGRGTAPSRASVTEALSPGSALPSGSSSGKQTGIRENAALGAAHLSRSSPGQGSGIMASGRGSVSGSSGMRHAPIGSRSRVGAPHRGAGRGTVRPSSGLASSVGKHPLAKGTVASSSLYRELGTGLNVQRAGR